MEIQSDFKELLELFNAHNVDYIIVGGYALAFHGAPRFTGDIDIFVAPVENNAEKIILALRDFGFESIELDKEDFISPEKVIQLGVPPVRIDIMTSLTGVSWAQAQSGKVPGNYSGVPVYFIGRSELIKNKKVLHRKKDIADIESLGEE